MEGREERRVRDGEREQKREGRKKRGRKEEERNGMSEGSKERVRGCGVRCPR